MSWNTEIVAIPGASLADLETLGFHRTDQIDLESALMPDGLAAAEYDGGLALFSRFELTDEFERFHQILGRPVYVAVFAGTAGDHVWMVAVDGDLRRWSTAFDLDEGEPMAVEAGIEDLDEDALFELLERATGFCADVERFEDPAWAIEDHRHSPDRMEGMTQPDDRQPAAEPGETRQILRMFGDDIADELKFVGLFLLVMVPAGAIGYLADGSDGAFLGAVAGAALVALAMVFWGARLVIGWLRRRSG